MDESAHTKGKPDRALATYHTVEAVVAGLILLFGLIFLYGSVKLGFRWGKDGPQSGFFPFYVSLFISLASAWLLGKELFGKHKKSDKAFVTSGKLRRVLAVLIPSLVYVLGIQLIGIYVSSLVFISLFMRKIGNYSWPKSVGLGLGVTVAFFLMFEVWFKVQLFKGYWTGFTDWTGF